MRGKGGKKKKEKKRKREGDGFRGVEEHGYWGGQDLILIMLDRHECFSVFHHLYKDKQRKQRHSLKHGKKRRESSKRNYYIISPRVIIKAIIIIINRSKWRHETSSPLSVNFKTRELMPQHRKFEYKAEWKTSVGEKSLHAVSRGIFQMEEAKTMGPDDGNKSRHSLPECG